MIFVDTGAWYALAIKSDSDHTAAKTFLATNRDKLVTSDYVVDELLTLFRNRNHRTIGVRWRRSILLSGVAVLHRVVEADFQAAHIVYETYADKDWSFTDCTSLALMQRLNINTAFSFDQHFRQFGTVNVVP